MSRGVVDVEMSFLDTLSMVSLRVAQAEQPLFKELVLLVPESKGDMLVTVSVTNTSYAVLSPSEGSRAGLVVGKVTPSITVVRVVLSDSCPLPLSSVASPLLPVLGTLSILFETLFFFAKILVVVDDNHVESRLEGTRLLLLARRKISAAGRRKKKYSVSETV